MKSKVNMNKDSMGIKIPQKKGTLSVKKKMSKTAKRVKPKK